MPTDLKALSEAMETVRTKALVGVPANGELETIAELLLPKPSPLARVAALVEECLEWTEEIHDYAIDIRLSEPSMDSFNPIMDLAQEIKNNADRVHEKLSEVLEIVKKELA
jgi:hypothetical protein